MKAPEFSHAPFAVRYAVGGWQLSGIFQAQSGAPITITAGRDLSGTALGSDRGVYNGANPSGGGACGTTRHCVEFLNTSAFSLPVQGTYGNIRKGDFRGPPLYSLDGGLSKDFPIRENLRLQFKAEFFNLLNRTTSTHPS